MRSSTQYDRYCIQKTAFKHLHMEVIVKRQNHGHNLVQKHSEKNQWNIEQEETKMHIVSDSELR